MDWREGQMVAQVVESVVRRDIIVEDVLMRIAHRQVVEVQTNNVINVFIYACNESSYIYTSLLS
jgi:flagella basal body P-ring formation protein FlgA